MKNAVIRSRVEAELKEEASRILASHGLEVSDAIRLFLRQVVRQGGLPFVVRDPSLRVASGRHLRSMKKQAQQRDRELLAKGELSGESVVMIRPDQVRGAVLKWPGPDVSLNDD